MARIKLDRMIGQVLDLKGRAALTQAEKNRERLQDYQANNPPIRRPKPPDRDRER